MAQPPRLTGDEARKAELIAELAASREVLSVTLQETLHDLNVVDHLRHSIARRKTAWFTGAAITGGLLSWVFGHKKKKKPRPAAPSSSRAELAPKGYAAIALAAATFLFNTFKPLITKVASRKIAEFAERGGIPR